MALVSSANTLKYIYCMDWSKPLPTTLVATLTNQIFEIMGNPQQIQGPKQLEHGDVD